MKKALLLLVFIFPLRLSAEEDWSEKITPEIALKAVHLFKSDPIGPDADGALSIIVNFAQKSDNVMVEISQKYLPWKLGEIDDDHQAKFIGAFVAGNIEYQLVNKINQNRPIEGIRLILFTYKRLLISGKISKQPEFERWIILDTNNELEKELQI